MKAAVVRVLLGLIKVVIESCVKFPGRLVLVTAFTVCPVTVHVAVPFGGLTIVQGTIPELIETPEGMVSKKYPPEGIGVTGVMRRLRVEFAFTVDGVDVTYI